MIIDKFIEKHAQLDKPIRAAVVGDLLVDEFFNCKVTRLSPEAGVPVLLTSNQVPTEVKLGGAGLVASQLANFCDCTLFCFKDQYEINAPFNIAYESVKQMPVKRRFTDGNMMYPRWDVEQHNYGEADLIAKRKLLFSKFQLENEKHKFNAVLLSDYGKGLMSLAFAQQIIGYCNDLNIPTFVDPKSHPIEMWSDCFVFKPNNFEIELLSDTSDRNKQVTSVKDKINCPYVIVTDKHNGVWGDVSIPSKKEIKGKSVSGAGDNFIAFLTLAYTMGFSVQEASEIAFEASYCYVQNNERNNILTIYDLKKYSDPIKTKMVTVDFIKNRDFKIVLSNGCYDLCNLNHINQLQFAKKEAEKRDSKLLVAVNSDDSVKMLKGNSRPILPLSDRMYCLASLSCVDFIVSFSELTPLELIKDIKPEFICKGTYKIEDIIGVDIVGESNVIVAPTFDRLSTTQLIDKIKYL